MTIKGHVGIARGWVLACPAHRRYAPAAFRERLTVGLDEWLADDVRAWDHDDSFRRSATTGVARYVRRNARVRATITA